MSETGYFRVTYERANGWRYELTGRGADESDAISAANDYLEYVERIGITDDFEPDWSTKKRDEAQLQVERIDGSAATPGQGLVVTRPDGTVVNK